MFRGIVASPSQWAATPLLHLQSPYVTLLVTFGSVSANVHTLAGFLTQDATICNRHTITGKWIHTVTRHEQTRTLPTSRFPNKRVFTTNGPSGTMIIYPSQRHINLPITLH